MRMLTLVLASLLQTAAPLTGKFTDGKLTTEWADGTGTFTLADKHYPAEIHPTDNGFAGSFTANKTAFPFTATQTGNTLTIITGMTTYTLHQLDVPANPLDAPQPTQSPTNSSAFTVLASTDAGKSLLAQKPGIASIKAALQATFPDLAQQLGARPTLNSAYEDAHDHRSGGATFTGDSAGKAVKGIVSCKLNPDGSATIAVIYTKVDSTRADWEALTAPVAATKSSPPADPKAILGADAQVYTFPDGTGSITLAAGYTTAAQSAATPIFIRGHAGQNAVINNVIVVATPDSPTAMIFKSNKERARQMGMGPLPGPEPIVAPFTDPVQALKDLSPQLSKLSQAQGGPAMALDRILSHQDVQAGTTGGKAAFITAAITKTKDGESKPYRIAQALQMCPIGNGVWTLYVTGLGCPESSFEKDAPVLAAMLNSIVINQQMLNQRTAQMNEQTSHDIQARGDANAAIMEAGQKQYMHDQAAHFASIQQQYAEQKAGYDQHNVQWQADELNKQRSSANFQETIKGTRTIYDTQTGESATANLHYVDGIVDSLNQAALDPNRFVQIPLRDELYPLPGK
jgi:hypothetical protein